MKNTTDYTKITKSLNAYTNVDQGWLLNSTVVLLNSDTYLLNGFTIAYAPSQIEPKPQTSMTKTSKLETISTALPKINTDYQKTPVNNTGFSAVPKSGTKYLANEGLDEVTVMDDMIATLDDILVRLTGYETDVPAASHKIKASYQNIPKPSVGYTKPLRVGVAYSKGAKAQVSYSKIIKQATAYS